MIQYNSFLFTQWDYLVEGNFHQKKTTFIHFLYSATGDSFFFLKKNMNIISSLQRRIQRALNAFWNSFQPKNFSSN